MTSQSAEHAANIAMDKIDAVVSEMDDHAKIEVLNILANHLADIHPIKGHPITAVQWVPADKVVRNDYNPNKVSPPEMDLLHTSIREDGYTQPIVVVRDEENDRFVVVDGFHRMTVGKTREDISESCQGRLPVVVLDKTLAERMAATVRHNRARGKHSVAGMSKIVFKMLDEGVEDHEICNRIGCSPTELSRLKVTTGFAKLFKDAEYSTAWMTRRQLKIEQEYEEKKKQEKEKKPVAKKTKKR